MAGQEIMAAVVSESYVEERLVSPRSAKFPWFASGVYLGDGEHYVSSYVDSQNRMGAMIRTYYSAHLLYLGDDNWELLGLELQ